MTVNHSVASYPQQLRELTFGRLALLSLILDTKQKVECCTQINETKSGCVIHRLYGLPKHKQKTQALTLMKAFHKRQPNNNTNSRHAEWKRRIKLTEKCILVGVVNVSCTTDQRNGQPLHCYCYSQNRKTLQILLLLYTAPSPCAI